MQSSTLADIEDAGANRWGRAMRRMSIGALTLLVVAGALGTFAVLTVGISTAQRRWGAIRPLAHGIPVVIVRDGKPDPEALAAERLSAADLFASAREEGITSLADLELAVLEVDGRISFFSRSEQKAGAAERPSTG